MFEHKVLEELFALKKDEVSGDKELCDSRMVKSGRLQWTGHVATMGGQEIRTKNICLWFCVLWFI
jgi:hypothetical protein